MTRAMGLQRRSASPSPDGCASESCGDGARKAGQVQAARGVLRRQDFIAYWMLKDCLLRPGVFVGVTWATAAVEFKWKFRRT